MRSAASIGSTEHGLTYRYEPKVTGDGVAAASGAGVAAGDRFGSSSPPPQPAIAPQKMAMVSNHERLTRAQSRAGRATFAPHSCREPS
jgi:hypothetical protein